MKNTKLIALGLVSTLFIVSCGKKVEEKTTNTWVTSTGIVASTWTISNTWVVNNEVSTGKVEENIATGTVVPENFMENEIKKVWDSSVLTNKNSWYEVTFKLDSSVVEKTEAGIDLFLEQTSSKNIFSLVTSIYQENTLEEYLDNGLISMKELAPDIKKESVEINGVKWFKISFTVDWFYFEQYLFEWKNKYAILLSKTLADKNAENFDSIVKSFKLVK